MKKNEESLSLFSLPQPLYETEFLALEGDKFRSALPFKLNFVKNLSEAQVIVWNGIITPKSAHIAESIIERLQQGAVLLYVSEPRTLYKGHPFVKFLSPENIKLVELAGFDVLPEELLSALQKCWEKIKNV